MSAISLGERLKAARKKRKLTLEAAGELVGFQKAYMSQIECDRHPNPPLKTVLALCRAYGISILTLTRGM